jgi:hypothetical protein
LGPDQQTAPAGLTKSNYAWGVVITAIMVWVFSRYRKNRV